MKKIRKGRDLTSAIQPSRAVIILAAGLGKRMKSQIPKVLHSVSGQPILFHVLDRLLEVAPDADIAVVVGHGREEVERAIRGAGKFSLLKIAFIHQAEQRGTGHAARCAMDSDWGEARVREKSLVLVLPGDSPLFTGPMIRQLLDPLKSTTPLRLLTCELPDPAGYGRVIRKGKSGPVQGIVEQKDANEKQKQVREVATSVYTFQASFLQSGLRKLSNRNAQSEYYLTDLVGQAGRVKKKIEVLQWVRFEDVSGINDPWQLAQANQIMNERVVRGHAEAGVRFMDPRSTFIEVGVEIGEGSEIQPGAILRGATRIGRDCLIGPRCVLEAAVVADGAVIKTGSVIDRSVIGPKAQIGPYAHLRPESQVGAETKIGNFVELKKSRIGAHTSVAHLSYLGDAEVGERVNIGCGFVTCNFDGRLIDGQRKHRTIIEDDVFLGSDCQTVAPVRIGRGAYVASGSTITEDVEPEALAIARSRQVVKPGYARKLKKSE